MKNIYNVNCPALQIDLVAAKFEIDFGKNVTTEEKYIDKNRYRI